MLLTFAWLAINVFIPSGAGSPGFAGILHCLKADPDVKVFCGDSQAWAYGKRLADGFCLMPASSHKGYLESVIKNALTFNCSVILPITTGELQTLSENQHLLAQNGLKIAISQPPAMKVANNKAALYRHLVGQYMPCPDFAVVSNKERFFVKLALLGFPKHNKIMKPSQGNGSRGFRVIVGAKELQDSYFETKAGSNKTTLEALKAELPETFPAEMLICEYLPGEEYSVDMLVNHGETLVCLIRLREKTVSGISVRGTFVDDIDIRNQCINIAADLHLHGPIGFQFKRSHTGFPKILEINPRLQGAVSTARFAGINFPLLAVKLALEQTLEVPVAILDPPVSFNRYWQDLQD